MVFIVLGVLAALVIMPLFSGRSDPEPSGKGWSKTESRAFYQEVIGRLVDGGADIRTAVAAPRWYVEPARHFAPPTDVHIEPRHAPGIEAALRAMGHDLVPTAAFDHDLGHEHAIELVDGGPGAEAGSVAAATDPRSEGLPAVW